jgi:hypothetical protein
MRRFEPLPATSGMPPTPDIALHAPNDALCHEETHALQQNETVAAQLSPAKGFQDSSFISRWLALTRASSFLLARNSGFIGLSIKLNLCASRRTEGIFAAAHQVCAAVPDLTFRTGIKINHRFYLPDKLRPLSSRQAARRKG